MAGFSFGAFLAGRALLEGLDVEGAIFISPPIAFMDLSFLPKVPGLKVIAVGDRDELCPLERLEGLWAAGQVKPTIRVVQGGDHFWGGGEEELFKILRDFSF